MEAGRSRQSNEVSSKLQDTLKTRLNEAQAHYRDASRELRDVTMKVNSGRISEPDSSQALHRARVRESAAHEEFTRALGIFINLVTEGKLPGGE